MDQETQVLLQFLDAEREHVLGILDGRQWIVLGER
jgi:hypothetical protein